MDSKNPRKFSDPVHSENLSARFPSPDASSNPGSGKGAQIGIDAQLFVKFLHDAHDPMVVVSTDGTIFFVNRAFAELTGRTLQELYGDSIDRVLRADDLERLDAEIARLKNGRDIASLNINLIDQLGAPRRTRMGLTPLAAEDGHTVAVFISLQDVTELEEAAAVRRRKTSELLAMASQMLSSSLDYQETLDRVVKLAGSTLADWCVIHSRAEDGSIAKVAAHHPDHSHPEIYDRLEREFVPAGDLETPMGRVFKTGNPEIRSHLTGDMIASYARTEEEAALLRSLGMKSFMMVPLAARGELYAVMTLISTISGKHFDQDDLELATELGRRAAYAIDNARLYEAQKVANQRLNDLLNGLQVSIWEGKGEPIDEVTFVNQPAAGLFGYPAERLKDPNFSRGLVLREDLEQMGAQYDAGIRSRRDFEVEYRARRGDGQIMWVRDVVRVTEDRDGRPMVRTVTSDVTQHKRAQERLRILAEAGRTLDASLDYDATLKNVTSLIVPALADDCLIFLTGENDEPEMVSSAHTVPARDDVIREALRKYPRKVRPNYPLYLVLETGLPMLLSDPGAEVMRALSSEAEEYELWRRLGIRSRIVVPLIARGQIIGAMSWFAIESERRYNEDDLKLAEQIASRAALAVDNSRLFKSAQEGVEARDRFLAMLGHELRNPLNSISIVAKLLQRETISDERLSKLRTLIGRETKQLTTLVDDLLDVSRVLAGKLSLALAPLDLTPLVREGVQSFEDMATQRELKLAVSIVDHPVMIAGDPVRMHQVIANLLTNAIKYTEPGGRVEVSLRDENGFAIIVVRDNGIGIPPEFLSSIFDPFTQAAELPPHGLGLGLSVVHQVAELHGGSITAASEGPGKGSEFTVRIPLASGVTAGQVAGRN